MFKIKNKQQTNQADVIDGKLILSFPGAINPIVWQMDIVGTKASAIEVLTKDDHYELALKGARNDHNTIASFSSREDAVNALTAVSRAMQEADGKIHAPTGGTYSTNKKSNGSWFATLLKITGIIILLFIIYAIIAIIATANMDPSQFNTASPTSAPADSTGMPMSADDFLNNQ